MADTKISALPGAAALAGTESLPVVQAGATVGATVSQLRDYLKSQYGLVLNNVAAGDPTTTSDAGHGYAKGSIWVNSNASVAWICVDSTTNAAVWEALSSATHPGFISGNWYPSYGPTLQSSTSSSANQTVFTPWVAPSSFGITDLAAWIQTPDSPSGTFQMGVYAADPTTHKPTGSCLGYTSGSLSAATAGLVVAGGLNQTVPIIGGRTYWFASKTNSSVIRYVANANADNTYVKLFGDPVSPSTYRTVSSANLVLGQTNTGGSTDLSAFTVGTLGTQATARAPAIDFKVA